MSEAAARSALLTHLEELVLSPAIPVAWPNVEFTPPTAAPWLKPDFLALPAQRPGLAHDSVRYLGGLLQVSVFVPLGTGEILASEIAGDVLAHFARGTKIVGDITVVIGSVTGANGEPTEGTPVRESNWLQLPTTIPWFALVA